MRHRLKAGIVVLVCGLKMTVFCPGSNGNGSSFPNLNDPYLPSSKHVYHLSENEFAPPVMES